VTIEITDIATGVAYVRHGLGIALLPRFILGAVEGVATLTVTGADLRWPLSLATPTDRPPGAPARALITLVHDVLAAG
jgi:DNA-binding transcriptional LysR family regulator